MAGGGGLSDSAAAANQMTLRVNGKSVRFRILELVVPYTHEINNPDLDVTIRSGIVAVVWERAVIVSLRLPRPVCSPIRIPLS